jgi:hypothetical protein
MINPKPSIWPRSAAMSLVIATVLALMTGVVNASSVTTLRAPYVRAGTSLRDTTLGPGTVLGGVDMLSASWGYAIAAPIYNGRGWFYLVKTSNLGRSWSVQAPLPTPSFKGIYGWGNEPSLDFLTPRIGYLSSYDAPLWVTVDAGATWSKVKTPGIDPSFAVTAHTLSVTSTVCSPSHVKRPWTCPSDLTQYRTGSATPYRTVLLPDVGADKFRNVDVLKALSPRSIVVVQEPQSPGPMVPSLWLTTDAGVQWRRLSNPCKGLSINQLLTFATHRWLLSCFGDGGMNQGTSELWDSYDAGTSWKVVARASEMGGLDEGGLRDVSHTLEVGGQGVLFATLGGAAGGVQVSTDGGFNWRLSNVEMAIFGGAPEDLSTFGARGAVVSVQGQAQFLTLNAETWIRLSPLPAGLYKGLSICTKAGGTKVTLGKGEAGIPGSTVDSPVIFTNEGVRSCYLNGTPTVQPVGGLRHSGVGRNSFAQLATKRGGFVILRAHGGKASVALGIQGVGSYQPGYCHPKKMNGVRISFNPPSRFFLATPRWSVCTGLDTTGVEGITRGVVNWQ